MSTLEHEFFSGHLLASALKVATRQHEGQKRKYTGQDYVQHPIAVARIIQTQIDWATDEMVAAALLHDVVEDTPYTIDDVRDNFGYTVATYVYFLTDISQPEQGNRAFRKQIDRMHNAEGPREAQTIKVADMIHNTGSIKKYDPDFWKVYRREKEDLLNLLTLADEGLKRIAWRQVLSP